jgi:hypothetical protein
MTKVFVLLAIVLMLSGGLVLFGPQAERMATEVGTRSLAPEAVSVAPSLIARAREIAELANAPLSILFGFISLFYSRRSYNINRARLAAEKAARSA